MIERTPTIPSTAGRNAAALGSVIRYAGRVATHIPSSATRRVNFTSQRLVPGDSTGRALEIDVANVGERSYRPTLWVEIYDAEGFLRAKIEQTRGLVYPGGALRQRFDLRGLAAGAYTAIVFADTGDDSIFAARYALQL